MKYCSILVFIALLSPRHVVLADKTSRRNLRVQRHQAYAHEHAPTRTRRLGKQNEANASSVDNQQGGKRGRNKKGKAGKTAPLDQLDPNNQIIQLDEPITLPAPSTSKNPTLSPVTNDPTSKPSASPSGLPSKSPSISPSHKPTIAPSQLPTQFPSLSPSSAPTLFPTNKPTQIPSISPSSAPTLFPTNKPTQFPSSAPTLFPTNKPTLPHCDLDAKEYSTGQYTGGDKVLYTDEEGTMTYICMFQQCGGVEGKTPGRWGGWGMIGGFCDPSPTTEALEPLTKEITIDNSTTKPTLSPSTPPTNKPTLPKCLGSEYNKESSPPYGAGNFAYYSANGEDYEYFKCRADGLCNLNAGSPGRPGWFLLGDCNPPSTESDLLSSSGCPEPWRNLATYHQNDYSSVMETDGTFVIYKCYNPEHCKTVAPGGYLSKTAWFVEGFC